MLPQIWPCKLAIRHSPCASRVPLYDVEVIYLHLAHPCRRLLEQCLLLLDEYFLLQRLGDSQEIISRKWLLSHKGRGKKLAAGLWFWISKAKKKRTSWSRWLIHTALMQKKTTEGVCFLIFFLSDNMPSCSPTHSRRFANVTPLVTEAIECASQS